VHDVITAYLPQAARDLGRDALERRAYILKRFDNVCGALKVSEIKPYDFQQWLNAQDSLKSEWSIRYVIISVKRCFNWAVEMELIERNPLARIRSRGTLPPQRRPMSDEHLQVMMRYSAPAYRRLLVFLKFTGCRPGEASAMRWRDVHFEQHTVVLEQHKTAKSTGKPRLIPLVPTVMKLLLWMRARRQVTVVGLVERLLRNGPMKGIQVARFLSHYGVSDRAGARARKALGVIRERVGGSGPEGYYVYRLPDNYVRPASPGDDDFVFTSCLGNPFNRHSLACYVVRLRRRSGLPKGVTLYDLRHRYGAVGIKNGVNLKLLSLAMGHQDVRMTEKYINQTALADDVQKAALQVAYGAGAVPADPIPPRPVEIINAGPVESIAITSEHLPQRYGNRRQRPHIKADVADVPMPQVPLSDPGEQSVASMLRWVMSKFTGQKKQPMARPTSSVEHLNPAHEKVYQAFVWALARRPELARAKDREVYEWLREQPDCPCQLPPTFVTAARYLSAARLYHATRKRILPGRPPPRGEESAAG
jgi:integrase